MWLVTIINALQQHVNDGHCAPIKISQPKVEIFVGFHPRSHSYATVNNGLDIKVKTEYFEATLQTVNSALMEGAIDLLLSGRQGYMLHMGHRDDHDWTTASVLYFACEQINAANRERQIILPPKIPLSVIVTSDDSPAAKVNEILNARST